MTVSYTSDLLPAVDAEPSYATSTPDAERAFANVFSLLERLADVLAAPHGPDGASAAEFESAVCGFIAHMRGTGATRAQVTARLVGLVQAASARRRTADETASRVATVMAWCERDGHPADGVRSA